MSDYRKDFREMQGDYYWSLPRVLVMAAGGFAGLCVIIFGLSYFGYASFGFFGPKYEAVRRDIMLQSRAYSEGETRNLYRLKIQYDAAPTPEAKQTVILAARHECEAMDRSRLPSDLATFCNPLGR